MNNSLVTVRGFNLSELGGITYLSPGYTCLTELTFSAILFMESIIVLFSFINMMLLCLPIISVMRDLWTVVPSSSLHSNEISTILSKLICFISVMWAPVKCFLKSMQNIGGSEGFCLITFVRWSLGLELIAVINSLKFSPLLLMEITISFLSGWWILSTLPPINLLYKSFVILFKNIPSKDIKNLHSLNYCTSKSYLCHWKYLFLFTNNFLMI